MPKQIFTNNATSVLSTAVNTSVTSLVLSNAAKFPSPTGGDWFYAALIGLDGNGTEISWEIVKCTARATNTLTVIRAQEGTVAAAWPGGTRVELRITAEFVNTVALAGPLSSSGITGAAASGANTDITSLGSIASINGGQLAGIRNKIINGKMDIAQRGTSFAGIASNTYSVDRYYWFSNATGVVTASQQADFPSNNEFQNSLRIAVTTADATIGTGEVAFLTQRVEGYNARDLIGKTLTLSFWVRSSKTGTHCAVFKSGGGDRAYVTEYSIITANTWEQKSVTVSGGLITAGTWNWTAGNGLQVSWALAAGTTFNTTPNAWQTGDFYATANQVNCLDTIGNIFAITGVQLEVGAVATPFEHRPYGAELALCQRYYETGNNVEFYYWNNAWGAIKSDHVTFKATKRAAPTIGGTFSGGGWTGTWSTANVTTNGFTFSNNATVNTGVFASIADWTANSEL